MKYKTIKERHNLDYFNYLYDKYENNVNDNNFNNIMLGSFLAQSSNSIRNYRNNKEKASKIVIDKDIYQNYHTNYFNLNSHNKLRDNSFLIANNKTNYNQIMSFLIIDKNKRNSSISPNIYINRTNLHKRKNNNSNINECNSYMNIHPYY